MLALKSRIARYSITLNYIHNNFSRPRNMIIHHGLMGNAKNFRNISKNSHISDYVNSYLVDCRNHGDSPHTATHSMENLADDLTDFIKQQKLDEKGRLVLMGHSMGAMALMKLTQKYPQLQNIIDRVILVDINCTPRKQDKGIENTGNMLKKMYQIDLKQDTKKVYTDIEERALSKDIAGLLKTNIIIQGEKRHKWIPNLETILKQFNYLTNFELHKNGWRKPIQVIYGANSIHVNEAQIKKYEQLYPQMTVDNFHRIENAGHWVHFDNISEFLKTMQKILKRDT